MSLLGGQLLTGRGVAPDTITGIRLIMGAAERGGGFACATAAMLWARGYAGQPDWPRALDYLQRSAELGYQPAQAQLRLLSGHKAGTDWKTLRRAVDPAAWRKLPARAPLSEAPMIQAAPGLLSPELCDALIERATPILAPAGIYDELRGGKTASDVRRHSAAEFHLTDTDLLTLAVNDRICALAGVSPTQSETPQVLHYKPGDHFGRHFDFWDPEFSGHAVALKQGQRTHTVLVYLNDENLEGGETDFPLVGLRHRGGKGDALMWRNVDSSGQPDRQTLHAGLPPTRGEKWVLSIWLRDRPPPGHGDAGVVAAMRGA